MQPPDVLQANIKKIVQMELKAAKRLGGGLAIQSLLILIASCEFIWLITVYGFDANDLLFFLANLFNPFAILGYAILFTSTYFLGRNAGKEIIISSHNIVRVGLKYALVTVGIFWGYGSSFCAIARTPQLTWNSLIWALLRISLLIIAAWLWAAWRIKRQARGVKPPQA
jgi:hypothetical protein